MSELLDNIEDQVRLIVDDERERVERTLQRSAIISIDDTEIEVAQRKSVTQEDLSQARINGIGSVATAGWFNTVQWLKDLPETDQPSTSLNLRAAYPLNYFDKEPAVGSFITINDVTRWIDRYSGIQSFGDGDGITQHSLRFATPGSPTITELLYPNDPNALDEYNARFRLYMKDLDTADTTIEFYRGWWAERQTSSSLKIGGLSLAGVGLNEVLHRGPNSDAVHGTRIVLHQDTVEGKHTSMDLIISEGEATTSVFRSQDNDREPAEEALLEATLELTRSMVAASK